jgi:protein ImuB
LLEQLYGMGLRTVGDLLRLPRGGVVRRLGQAWLDELDRALGRRPDVRHGFRGPEHFSERRVLEHEIETAAGLEFACQPLMARLQAFLRRRQAAITVLALDLKHRTHPVTRLRIGLAAPSGDVEHLRGLLAERLAALALPAPVIAIRMRSGALLEQVLATDSFRNFTPSPRPGERVAVEGSCDADALPRLIERLRARLGNDAVFGMSEVEDHRPERAWRVIEPSPRPSPQPSPASGRGRGGRRPLWLVTEPLPLIPTLTPTLSRKRERELELLCGPERIETGWWDGREVTRDYFVARDAQGVRLWIYRERRAPKNWYVHGLFG